MRLMHYGKQVHWCWDDTTPGVGMGNLFEQSLFILFDILIMMLVQQGGTSFEKMAERHRNFE
jgi:6-phospho-3-hexuloisomerase